MTDLVKEIKDTLAILSTLSVSGDAVDVMALAKTKLRKAAARLEEVKDDGQNNCSKGKR